MTFKLSLGMELKERISRFKDEIYFFIFKRVKDENFAKDIFQNVQLKAFENCHQIRDPHKLRPWLYQIARNEIKDFFYRESRYVQKSTFPLADQFDNPHRFAAIKDFCCFHKFIYELPEIYREVVKQIYINGKTQKETADLLQISLANVKIRISRAKEILKTRFKTCCRYEIDNSGKLIGEPDCERCNTVLGNKHIVC